MKKKAKTILIFLTVVSLLCSLSSTALAMSIQRTLVNARERSLAECLNLRTRIRTLEGQLKEAMVGWIALDTTSESEWEHPSADVETATESVTEETNEVAAVGGTSINADDIAYGAADGTTETSFAPSPVFTIKVYEGVIGVFDDGGKLIRTVNVYVETLPAADRNALSMGICVTGEQEMRAIVDRYA